MNLCAHSILNVWRIALDIIFVFVIRHRPIYEVTFYRLAHPSWWCISLLLRNRKWCVKQEVMCQSELTPTPPKKMKWLPPADASVKWFCVTALKPHLIHLNLCKQEIFFYLALNDVCATRANNITAVGETSLGAAIGITNIATHLIWFDWSP